MPFLVTVLLVIAVHLATNLAVWQRVGLLADDRFAVGLSALLELQGRSFVEQLGVLFLPDLQPGMPVALYRPFLQLTYLLEYPFFGTDAVGYHVTNSVLHCANAVMWSVLVRRLSGSAMAGFAAAILFVGWPGHGEATHWIASRVNLLSAFWMCVALLFWTPPAGKARGWPRVLGTMIAAVIALGSKESAVLLVPLLLLADLFRPGGVTDQITGRRARLRRLVLASLPVWIVLGGWLSLRAAMLHTWGTGTTPVWQLDVWSPFAWIAGIWNWLRVLVAPVHMQFLAWWFIAFPFFWLTFGGFAACAFVRPRETDARCKGHVQYRRAVWFATAACACCLVAIAGLHHQPDTLEGMRHSYEAALGFATILGLGIANTRCDAVPLLVVLSLLNITWLDANRENWLRAGALRSRAEAEAFLGAERAPEPIRILDMPSVWHGAFVQLIEDPTVFSVPFAPPAANGRGRASPDKEWPSVLRELAGRAARKEPHHGLFTVGWADGHLMRQDWDDRWPLEIVPGVTIEFARIGRMRPFVGMEVPVQLLVRASVPAVVTAIARGPKTHVTSPPVEVVLGALTPVRIPVLLPTDVTSPPVEVVPGASMPVRIPVLLPADVPPESVVELGLRVNAGGNEREIKLGQVVPAAWSVRPW